MTAHRCNLAGFQRAIAQKPAAVGKILSVIICVSRVVNDVVVAEIFFHEGDVDRLALEIDAKDISLLVEKCFDVQTFSVGGF